MIANRALPNRRFVVLAGLALLLLAVLVQRSIESGSNDEEVIDPRAELTKEFQRLSRYEEARETIRKRYAFLFLPYAEQMANVLAFNEEKRDHKMLAENVIRSQLEAFGLADAATVSVGEAEVIGEGVSLVRATVSYETGSDRDAIAGLYALGGAHRGTVWESFTVRADAERQTVFVSGQLAILIIDPAE